MAAHLNSLHLSTNFVNHELQTAQTEAEEQEMNVGMTPETLEEMLKTAQKITVCEEVRKLTAGEDQIKNPNKCWNTTQIIIINFLICYYHYSK